MEKKRISIVTDWGPLLGSGHVQRMTSFAWFLHHIKGIDTAIISKKEPPFTEPGVQQYFRPSLDRSALIVRDMRDSTTDEIELLQRSGHVLALDDIGPGREKADFVMDILPNPLVKKNPPCHDDCFIYGYNFIHSVKNIKKNTIEKTIDVAVYPGVNPADEYIGFLRSILPGRTTAVIFVGDKSIMIRDGKPYPVHKPFAEILLSSKVLITHFGILLYEGYISGCRLVTINPSQYHSDLSDMVREKMHIINLGLQKSLDQSEAKKQITVAAESPRARRISPAQVIEQIENNLELFYSRIEEIIVG